MKVIRMDKVEATLALKDGELIMDLDHPNILRYDEFFYNEKLSIVMEYLPCNYNLCNY